MGFLTVFVLHWVIFGLLIASVLLLAASYFSSAIVQKLYLAPYRLAPYLTKWRIPLLILTIILLAAFIMMVTGIFFGAF